MLIESSVASGNTNHQPVLCILLSDYKFLSPIDIDQKYTVVIFLKIASQFIGMQGILFLPSMVDMLVMLLLEAENAVVALQSSTGRTFLQHYLNRFFWSLGRIGFHAKSKITFSCSSQISRLHCPKLKSLKFPGASGLPYIWSISKSFLLIRLALAFKISIC